jgi:oligoribonuclease NrnB/cAMP/cGMP phosphodiesterase (DHH superfamily)
MRPFVIYHGNCMDGICAATVVGKVHPRAQFYPGSYGQPPPLQDLAGRDVIIVDFSYPLEEMRAILIAASSLLVLDHHQSAEKALEGFPGAIFDMNRSGAGLAWDALAGRSGDRPWIVDYVEDRDLWRFALPNSREINAYLNTLPYDRNIWEQEGARTLDEILPLGRGAWAYLQHYAKTVAQAVTRRMAIRLPDGREFTDIPVANCPFIGGSEVCEILAKDEPFAAYWYRDRQGRFVYGLRSDPKGVDVATIAEQYGGGGHAHASGFRSDHSPWEAA